MKTNNNYLVFMIIYISCKWLMFLKKKDLIKNNKNQIIPFYKKSKLAKKMSQGKDFWGLPWDFFYCAPDDSILHYLKNTLIYGLDPKVDVTYANPFTVEYLIKLLPELWKIINLSDRDTIFIILSYIKLFTLCIFYIYRC